MGNSSNSSSNSSIAKHKFKGRNASKSMANLTYNGNTSNARLTERQTQFKELQDISATYLDHFEFLIEYGTNHTEPRKILSILKSNLKTARQEIKKLPTKPQSRRRYSSAVSIGNHRAIITHQKPKQKSKHIKHNNHLSQSSTDWVEID